MGIKSFCLVIVVVLLSVYYHLALIQSIGVKTEVQGQESKRKPRTKERRGA
jgi:hypothetical protein